MGEFIGGIWAGGSFVLYLISHGHGLPVTERLKRAVTWPMWMTLHWIAYKIDD